LEVTWVSADPAVCARLMASLAFWLACDRPPIWVWKRVAMAKPAALSAELLIFRPEDRSSVAVFSARRLVQVVLGLQRSNVGIEDE